MAWADGVVYWVVGLYEPHSEAQAEDKLPLPMSQRHCHPLGAMVELLGQEIRELDLLQREVGNRVMLLFCTPTWICSYAITPEDLAPKFPRISELDHRDRSSAGIGSLSPEEVGRIPIQLIQTEMR